MGKEEINLIIENKILIIRGIKVMLDFDIAELYQVETRHLIQAVKRNYDRFPQDFVFQLSESELISLKSQIVISKTKGRGGRRYVPFAFTEHGVAMLSSVLRSPRAVQMNIFIIRAFIKLRELLSSNKDLAQKVEKLERIQGKQGEQILAINSVVRRLIEEPIKPKSDIGFRKA